MTPEAQYIANRGIQLYEDGMQGGYIYEHIWQEILILGGIYRKICLADKMLEITQSKDNEGQ